MLQKLLEKILFFFSISLCAQTGALPFYTGELQEKWVESTLHSLSLEQKIGQLFMIHAYSQGDKKQEDEVLEQIKKYQVGGLIFMKGKVERQVGLTNRYQKATQVPLLIGLDAEWGLAMRLENTFKFPWMMTLGATHDKALSYRMAKEIGRQCKRIGVHINFAPVIDINNNYKNPIIGLRSFGSDKMLVSQMGQAYIRGLQDAGVIACAKHFPGHGNTDKDSHKTLPTVPGNADQLLETELFPFAYVAPAVHSIMVGHLSVPAYDTQNPASLSSKIVRQLLQKKMKYKGLVITDALNMQGVARDYAPGEIALQAIKAGNDILLFPSDLKKSIDAIKNAINKGELTVREIDQRVRKILAAKYWCGLRNKRENLAIGGLEESLYSVTNRVIERKVYESAVTLLSNPKRLLPLDKGKSTGLIFLGTTETRAYQKTLTKLGVNWKNLGVITTKGGKLSAWRKRFKKLKRTVQNFDQIIIVISRENQHPWVSPKLNKREQQLISTLASHPKVVLNLLTSPYALESLPPLKKEIPILLSYQSATAAQSVSPQMIFGALAIKGKLPISLGKRFHFGQGVESSKKILGFSFPDAEGLDSVALSKVNSYIQDVIDLKATPGAQLLVIRHGNIVLHKPYGSFTYRNEKGVTLGSVYDVASLTKVVASLPLVMKMVEDFDLSLDSPLSQIYPPLQGSNKENMTLKQVLSHSAGLQPWIPFYRKTLDSISKEVLPNFYSTTKTDTFSISVAKNFFAHRALADTIRKTVYDSPLLPEPHGYKYSDLGYYIIKDIIEHKYQKSIDTLLTGAFIKPLGLQNMCYKPTLFFGGDIVPSQEEDSFRPTGSMYGYVNDEGAAMLGGVSGHAGIFSNALDIGVIMQMFLNGGVYNKKRFLREETIQKFNRTYYSPENRRGVGFDKPQTDPSQSGSTCGCISMRSFGHFGFTGTYAWADPAQSLIIVFLSNRTYPARQNNILAKKNIRTEIQRLVYLSLYEHV